MDSKFSSTAPMGAVGASALGVISRGLRGVGPLLKIFDHLGGLSPSKILVLALLFKVC